MPASSLGVRLAERFKGRWPEILVGLLASIIFLGSLGSVEIWGKREQRASLEAADTLDNQHWLVAQIQGHPRLEKPPLSRWLIASLMALTGRRDEAIVRLPTALSALAMIGLVYGLGCRIGGRSVGLSSALILCSTAFFISEMRQAGNDSLLALFTTLALYAAWRRLEAGPRRWNFVMYMALGLGILAKGPIILLLVGTTILPYLMIAGRFKPGMRQLADGPAAILFLMIALAWPTLVIIDDPHAMGIWGLEMGQKIGFDRVTEHRRHAILARDWPGMVLPWPLVAALGVALPFIRISKSQSSDEEQVSRRLSPLWFPWCWAIGNLAMFCLWRVAKPSYYLPCLPGTALLLGAAWVRLTRDARIDGKNGAPARSALQFQWVFLFVGACVAPLVSREYMLPSVWPWMSVLAAALALGVIASAFLWKIGSDALALAPMVAACAITVWIGYGIMAPAENSIRGHRALAQSLDRIVEPGSARVLFLQEIDEGLSFYLRNRRLEPVPGSERRYNATYDYLDDFRNKRRGQLTRREVEEQVPENLKQTLIEWLDGGDTKSDYLLVPTRFYDRFAAELAPRTTTVLREESKKRNELTLLRLGKSQVDPVASAPAVDGRTIR